jgi:hypothetical protein
VNLPPPYSPGNFYKWVITIKDAQGHELETHTFIGNDAMASAEGRRLAGPDRYFSVYSKLDQVYHRFLGYSRRKDGQEPSLPPRRDYTDWILEFIDENGKPCESIDYRGRKADAIDKARRIARRYRWQALPPKRKNCQE